MTACFLAQFAADPRCNFYRPELGLNLPDRAHLIPQQRLTDEEADDRRSYVMSCRKHHHAFDNGFIRLRELEHPQCFRMFARELDFFYTDRGWRREQPKEAA